MAGFDSTLGGASQNLVEKSQDSVRVTKQRLHRASINQDDEEGDVEAPIVDPREDSIAQAHRRLGHTEGGGQASKEGKKSKTRFHTETDCEYLEARDRKRSLGRRISEALSFRKMGMREAPPQAVESSPPSIHVKFQSEPQVIE